MAENFFNKLFHDTTSKVIDRLKAGPLVSGPAHEVAISLEAISDLWAGIALITIGIDHDFEHHFGLVASILAASIGWLKEFDR